MKAMPTTNMRKRTTIGHFLRARSEVNETFGSPMVDATSDRRPMSVSNSITFVVNIQPPV